MVVFQHSSVSESRAVVHAKEKNDNHADLRSEHADAMSRPAAAVEGGYMY